MDKKHDENLNERRFSGEFDVIIPVMANTVDDTMTGGARALAIVRKLRAAGMEQPTAEAVGEVLSELPTRAEVREDIRTQIRLALAEQFQKTVWLVIGVQTLGVAVLAFLLK
ncbi:MAG: hypothetical protein HAW59_05125 [Betaproteobacteria bacterium]|nr:hypothetical protein [Betaproteobacteria bacterium]